MGEPWILKLDTDPHSMDNISIAEDFGVLAFLDARQSLSPWFRLLLKCRCRIYLVVRALQEGASKWTDQMHMPSHCPKSRCSKASPDPPGLDTIPALETRFSSDVVACLEKKALC